jgi:hypothetical protein
MDRIKRQDGCPGRGDAWTARCICIVHLHGAEREYRYLYACDGFRRERLEGRLMQDNNGIPADQLPVSWRKSRHSNPSGECVEVATLADGSVAVRNSRHPSGPALIYTPGEISAFLAGVKDGQFDDLA